MTFVTGPTWAYKDIVTSAKLAQIVENIRAHDHRADSTQGLFLGESASGTDTVTITAAGSPFTRNVTFPAGRFSVAPHVIVVAITTNPSIVSAGVQSVTTTTLVVSAIRTSGAGNIDFYWVAFRRP